MNRIKTFIIWAYWLFKGKIATIEDCIKMGLTHETNLFGEAIIMTGFARSVWNDKYGRRFCCEKLLEDGRDVVMEELQKKYPHLFKPNIENDNTTIDCKTATDAKR